MVVWFPSARIRRSSERANEESSKDDDRATMEDTIPVKKEREPFEQAPPCYIAENPKSCSALPDCSWCGDPFVKYSYNCFESSLWKCPQWPQCQRAREELWGYRVGSPSPLVVIGSIMCFILTGLLFKRRCADRPLRKHKQWKEAARQRREALRSISSSSLATTSTEETIGMGNDFEYTLLNHADVPPPSFSHIAMGPIPSRSERVLTLIRRHISRMLMVFSVGVCLLCMMALVISPNGPEFTVCDIRWDIGSLHQNDGVHILAELSVSIWNPDRFDIDLAAAKGSIYFHDGVLARFHWEPRGDMVRVTSGHVYDMRVVVSVDWNAVQQVPNLVEDWVSVDGIVFALDASAFISLRVMGVETPKLSVGATGIRVPLNDANRNLCRCTV